jgi:integrase
LASAWRVHVNPRWGRISAGDIRHSDVRGWVSELSTTYSATTVIRAYGSLAAILDIAVRDRRIAENPARGVRLPKKQPKRRVYLTHDQVRVLAETSRYPGLVYFLAYTGLRWGEATGLLVQDVDLARRRVFIQENAVLVGSTLHIGTPKTHVKRSVPFPEFLTPLIASAMTGKRSLSPVFGDGDGHLIRSNSQDGWFAAAVKRGSFVQPSHAARSPAHGRKLGDQLGSERSRRPTNAGTRLRRDDSGHLRRFTRRRSGQRGRRFEPRQRESHHASRAPDVAIGRRTTSFSCDVSRHR